MNKLRVMDVSESMLKEIGEHSAQHSCPMKVDLISLHNHLFLSKIDFRGVNLSSIESSLLAGVLKNFEEVNVVKLTVVVILVVVVVLSRSILGGAS